MAAFLKGFSFPSRVTTIILIQKGMAELISTLIMMFLGCSSLYIDLRFNIGFIGVAFAWLGAVIGVGYAFGHISGCHMNPAITIGLAIAKEFPWKDVPLYGAAQLLGSTLACMMVFLVFRGEDPTLMMTLPGGPNPIGNMQAVTVEIIIASILMLVIRSAGTHPRAFKPMCGIAVAGVLFSNIVVAGKLTGASMNPARSLGPAIVAFNFTKIWIYLISPVIGTIIGSLLYHVFSYQFNLEEKGAKGAASDAFDNPVNSGVSFELV